jgi:hypothetical protein
VEKNSYAELSKENGNIGAAMVGFIKISIFKEGYGNLWDEKNDNELLGVKGLSSAEVEDLVAKSF